MIVTRQLRSLAAFFLGNSGRRIGIDRWLRQAHVPSLGIPDLDLGKQ